MVILVLLGALVALSGTDETAAVTPTPSPTPTPGVPSTVATFVNDTGQVVNDLHVEVGLAGSVSLVANAPGCPVPSLIAGSLFSSFDVVWSATCVDPGESVTLEIFADCFAPLCGPPPVFSHFWTLDGAEVGTPTPTPLCGNTPTGSDVSVPLAGGLGSAGGVELTFSTVAGCGTTTVTTSTAGPLFPGGWEIVGLYYDINSTATFSGPVTVCITYDETEVAGSKSNLRLWHHDGTAFTDITTSLDTANDIICGETATLSIFVILIPIPPEAVGGVVELVAGPSDSPDAQPRGPGHEREMAALAVALAVALAAAGVAGVSWQRYRRRAG